MTHLDPAQLVDLLESRGSAAAAAHVDGCGHCRSQLASLRSTIEMVSADETPEPSPLFWAHFASHVSKRIDAPGSGWIQWTRRRGFAAALTCASVLFVLFVSGRAFHLFDFVGDMPAPATTGPQSDPRSTQSLASDEPRDDVEADAAWAVVRTAAQDLAYEEAEAEGIAPRPGSAEIAVLEMSSDERAELARLLENELKRTGA